MKRFIIVLISVIALLLSGCTPSGGYIECFQGLIVFEDNRFYIWIPEIGNVEVPSSDKTTLLNSQETYEIKEGDWADIYFERNDSDIYITESTNRTFVQDAISISVPDERGHNIEMRETIEGTEVTLQLISEFNSFSKGDNMYLFEYVRNSLKFYTEYQVVDKDKNHITMLIPTSEVLDFMQLYLYDSLEFGTSRNDF